METLNCLESNPAAKFFLAVICLALIVAVSFLLVALSCWLWQFVPGRVDRFVDKLIDWTGKIFAWSLGIALALFLLWGAWETLLCVIN